MPPLFKHVLHDCISEDLWLALCLYFSLDNMHSILLKQTSLNVMCDSVMLAPAQHLLVQWVLMLKTKSVHKCCTPLLPSPHGLILSSTPFNAFSSNGAMFFIPHSHFPSIHISQTSLLVTLLFCFLLF